MLFTSAFLSELYSDKKIKISAMKVGGSPLYFVPGHENQLEKYSQYLGSKEKEAYDLLQKNKILKDSEQQPAIRVALRALHDFAIPFKNNEDIYWRYLTFSENDVKNIFDNKLQKEISKDTNKNIEKINISSQIQQPNKINERKKEINTEPKKEEFKENKEEHKTLKAKFESPL